MGAWDTVFALASIGIQGANAANIHQMMEQRDEMLVAQLTQIAVESEQQSGRDLIYRFKQRLDELFDVSPSDQFDAAVQLATMRWAIAEAGLTPEFFKSLPDKDFASRFQKDMRQLTATLESQLTDEHRQAIARYSQALVDHSEANFYLLNQEKVDEYRSLKAAPQQKGYVLGGCSMKTIGIFFAVGAVVYGLGGLVIAASGVPELVLPAIAFAVICALVAYVALRQASVRQRANSKIEQDRERVASLENELDSSRLAEFDRVRARFASIGMTTREAIIRFRDEALAILSSYSGDLGQARTLTG